MDFLRKVLFYCPYFLFNFLVNFSFIQLQPQRHTLGSDTIMATESNLKMFFILRQQLFSLSSYLSFCLDFLVMQENGFIKKDQVDFKIYDVTTWLRNTCSTYILTFISTSKGNQVMKLGQPIDHNLRNTFLETSSIKCGEETIPRDFFKHISGSIFFSFISFVFIVYQVEEYQD